MLRTFGTHKCTHHDHPRREENVNGEEDPSKDRISLRVLRVLIAFEALKHGAGQTVNSGWVAEDTLAAGVRALEIVAAPKPGHVRDAAPRGQR